MLSRIVSSVRSMSLAASVLLAVVALSAVLAGCFSDFAPVSPSRDSVGVSEPNWLTFDVPENVRASKTILESAATIDPVLGGLVPGIQVGSSLGISFEVPAQSGGSEFDSPANISLSVNELGVLIVDFGPDGTQFDPPAALVIRGARLRGNSVSLYLQNPSTGAWEKQTTPVNVDADGTLRVAISHFSRYGLAD